jgi:hypothetical protein
VPIIIGREWPRVIRKIRFISFIVTTYLLGISIFIWLSTREYNLLLVSVVVSLLGGLIILSWPITSPNFVERYGLNW